MEVVVKRYEVYRVRDPDNDDNEKDRSPEKLISD